MITLYTYGTPNGQKASVVLEELDLAYRVHVLDLAAGENKRPDYLKISPIGKLPAILETLPEGGVRRLFGSGAILMHYAEREGRLMPTDPAARAEALSWLFLGIGDLGPSAVEMFRFSVRMTERVPAAIDLFKGELMRCYGAIEERLSDNAFLGGTEYSIADIACFPFIDAAARMREGFLDRFPAMARWHGVIAERPAVRRGMSAPVGRLEDLASGRTSPA